MEHVSVRDQGSLGICYSEVVAQAYDAFRNSTTKNSSRQNTSAYVLSAKMQNANDDDSLAVKRILDDAVKAQAEGKPVEWQGMMPKGVDFQRASVVAQTGNWLQSGGQICDALAGLKKFGASPSLKAELDSLKPLNQLLSDEWRKNHPPESSTGLVTENAVNESAERVQNCLREQGLSILVARIADALKANKKIVIQQIVARSDASAEAVPEGVSCRSLLPNKTIPSANLISYGTSPKAPPPSQQDVLLSFSNHFKSKRPIQPVMIAMCSAMLTDENKTRSLLSTPAEQRQTSKDCGFHAVLAVGQRRDPKNPRNCQVLLRNSWGKRL